MAEQKFKNNLKLEVKSYNEDQSQSSEDNNKRLLSFDVYFQKLIANKKTLPHHKAPMRKYSEQKGLTNASEEEFDEVFKSY